MGQYCAAYVDCCSGPFSCMKYFFVTLSWGDSLVWLFLLTLDSVSVCGAHTFRQLWLGSWGSATPPCFCQLTVGRCPAFVCRLYLSSLASGSPQWPAVNKVVRVCSVLRNVILVGVYWLPTGLIIILCALMGHTCWLLGSLPQRQSVVIWWDPSFLITGRSARLLLYKNL